MAWLAINNHCGSVLGGIFLPLSCVRNAPTKNKNKAQNLKGPLRSTQAKRRAAPAQARTGLPAILHRYIIDSSNTEPTFFPRPSIQASPFSPPPPLPSNGKPKALNGKARVCSARLARARTCGQVACLQYDRLANIS